jgi:hypothetical protein
VGDEVGRDQESLQSFALIAAWLRRSRRDAWQQMGTIFE